uniref:Uncharacterized protein n=1 Tax=Physcomitrium patens TaxID=3218 RepID=A0A2K1JKB3_PHYPA|nr:hypothetical protein PHYPA_016824 [Physcomitrium patens]
MFLIHLFLLNLLRKVFHHWFCKLGYTSSDIVFLKGAIHPQQQASLNVLLYYYM